jgi:hypothetical protein
MPGESLARVGTLVRSGCHFPESTVRTAETRPVARRTMSNRNVVAVIRIPRFWTGTGRTKAAEPLAIVMAAPAGLDAFASEDPRENVGAERGLALVRRPDAFSPDVSTVRQSHRHYLAGLRWTAVIVLSAGTGAAGLWTYQRRPPAPPVTSDLIVATSHSGIADPAPVAPAAKGKLYVETDPPNLRVLVDGVVRGLTPLTIEAIEPGDHQVTVGADAAALHRTVSVHSNERVTLIISKVEEASTAAGWLAVSSPIALQLREGDRIVGTTDAPRVMLPSGERDLVLVNESLGFLVRHRVTIAGGKTARLAIDVPKGTLSVNAQPWAEVWLDGRSLGQTPIGNINTPIGSHDLVFRHPQLGERHDTIVVDLKQPARVAVDMRKK